MLCGLSTYDIKKFFPGGPNQFVVIDHSCTPDNDTQAMIVTPTYPDAIKSATLKAYLTAGGIVLTSYGASDNVYSLAFSAVARIIPPSPVPTPGQQLALGLAGSANDRPDDDTESSPRPRRLGWAKLLDRVFAVDVTVCRMCGGRMRILEVVETADDIARVLHGARAPPRPHPPAQVLLFPG